METCNFRQWFTPFFEIGADPTGFFTLSTIDQIRDSQVSYSPSLTWLANNVEKSKEEEAKATEEFISCFRIKRPLWNVGQKKNTSQLSHLSFKKPLVRFTTLQATQTVKKVTVQLH